MTRDEPLQQQIERYRATAGQQRLEITLNLYALSCQVARERFRRQFRRADDVEIERRLREQNRAAFS